MALPNAFVKHCRSLLGVDNVISDPESLGAYECDALSAYRQVPALPCRLPMASCWA